MRLSILWGIMEIEEGVMRRGRRPRRINIAKTCLPPSIMKIGILPIVKNATHVTLSRYFNNSQSSLIAYNLSWLDFFFHSLPDTTIATIRGTTSTRTQWVGHCRGSDSDLSHGGGSHVGRFDLVETQVAWYITSFWVPKTARWIWLWAVELRKCVLRTFNHGQKSLGQYCNMHIFPSFLGSLLKQCVIFEIFLQFSLPPPYTKLKLRKNSGYSGPTLFVGWGEGSDLCELKNTPETQKCPKTFVYDCLLSVWSSGPGQYTRTIRVLVLSTFQVTFWIIHALIGGNPDLKWREWFKEFFGGEGGGGEYFSRLLDFNNDFLGIQNNLKIHVSTGVSRPRVVLRLK